MLRSAAIKRVLPAIAVAAVLGASLLATPLGGIIASVGCSYGYLGAPTVTGVSPSSGSGASNNFVVITGCGFTGATSVQFGAAAAAGFNVVSDSEVDAASPVHAAGTVDVTVTTPAGTSATSTADQYTFVTFATGPCTSATISPVSVVKQAGNPSIPFHATSLGCPTPKYAFWVNYLGKWYLKRAFSTDPTFNLDTTYYRPGHYVVRVWANQTPSHLVHESYADATVTLTGCTVAGITGSTDTSVRGAPVTFTATSGGCTNPQYQFYLKDTAGVWHMMQAFSSSNVWTTWNNATSPKGTYYIGVWVNSPGSYMKTRQAWAYISHVVT